MCTWPQFESEGSWNSEVAFCHIVFLAISCTTGNPEKRYIAPLKHPHGAIRQNTNLKEVSLVSDILNLVPRHSLLTHCPCEVWERVGESLSGDVTVHGRVQA